MGILNGSGELPFDEISSEASSAWVDALSERLEDANRRNATETDADCTDF